MIYKTNYCSSLGNIVLASDDDHLIGLWLEGQKYFLGSVDEDMIEKDDLAIFDLTKKWLDDYFKQKKPSLSNIPLSPRGTDFQKRVWTRLCQIPYGEVTTYGILAKEIAKLMNKETMSAQAIGGAVSHNPISIIIPCHRVVGTQGSLTGYAGGLDKKIKLLELEGVNINNYSIPKQGRNL